MTYDELTTNIRDYTEVGANVLTQSIIDTFIQNAEFKILRDVDSDNNRKYSTSTLVGGQRYINVPANVLVIRSAQIIDSNVRHFLEKRDTSFISEYNDGSITNSRPKYYANWDENTIALAPTPDTTYTIQLNYILKPTGLSSSNTTTYISQEFPNGLLYACLVEAYGFLKGPIDLLQLYDGKYKEATQGFLIEQTGRRRRDEYQEGVPRLGKQGE